tara:strand:+ start:1571 stop:1942 length:372 start_codon:yes stop_codon:yes gene_type:complete
MEHKTTAWFNIAAYVALVIAMFTYGSATAQNLCDSEICVVQFNTSWNESNNVDYLDNLTDCSVMNINIDEGLYQKEYGIVVVPTIIVFNGKEVERFQANIMMEIEATKKEVQSVVNELLMSKF